MAITVLDTTTKNPLTLMGERAGICYGSDVNNPEMTKPILYMMIGLPASGKSTWAKVNLNCPIVSTDDIRKEFFGDATNQSDGDRVFKEAYLRINEHLLNKESVCFDATNISRKSRRRVFNSLKTNDVEVIAVCMCTPIPTIIFDNNHRDRTVPTSVIFNMLKSFNLPEEHEGFSKIRYIHRGTKDNLWCDLDKLLQISVPHDTPYHSELIDEHMKKCNTIAKTHTEDQAVIEAALYHDIGKYFTKEFDKDTGIAHYIGHENAGAYIYLCSKQYQMSKFKDTVPLLIQEHDRFPKLNEKHKNMFIKNHGDKFCGYLAQLHEFDRRATVTKNLNKNGE